MPIRAVVSYDVMDDIVLKIDEVAAMLKLSRRSVMRQYREGLMPQPVRLGRSLRWRRDELLRWICAGCPRMRAIRVAPDPPPAPSGSAPP